MAFTRREFLGVAAASGALAFDRPDQEAKRVYHPLLATQVYVFTQQFKKEKKTLEQGMADAFPAIHRAGFRRVELTAEFLEPQLLEQTAYYLKKNKLQLHIAYTGGVMHDPKTVDKAIVDALEVAERARFLGAKALNVNPNPLSWQADGAVKTEEQLETQVKILNLLGNELQIRGMQLLVHQHAPEMKENAREWYYVLTHTDPKQVFIGLDVHWVLRGGQDPMTLLREAADRLGSLHLRNSEKGVWTESFDKGDIDYSQVADYLKEIEYSGYLVVELAYEKDTKITRPLEEDEKLSRQFAERTFDVRA
jgi:inosose dehydratase